MQGKAKEESTLSKYCVSMTEEDPSYNHFRFKTRSIRYERTMPPHKVVKRVIALPRTHSTPSMNGRKIDILDAAGHPKKTC